MAGLTVTSMSGPGVVSEGIGSRIRKARLARKWSTDRLEDEAFISRGTVFHIESGNRGKNITIDTLVFIAQALEISVLELIYEDGKPRFIPPSSQMKQSLIRRREKRAVYQDHIKRERAESHGRGKRADPAESIVVDGRCIHGAFGGLCKVRGCIHYDPPAPRQKAKKGAGSKAKKQRKVKAR